MPNAFLGIIFGQRMGIENMEVLTIPRVILERVEGYADEGMWGRICIEKYLDQEEVLHIL
jgi:hypothetical protein